MINKQKVRDAIFACCKSHLTDGQYGGVGEEFIAGMAEKSAEAVLAVMPDKAWIINADGGPVEVVLDPDAVGGRVGELLASLVGGGSPGRPFAIAVDPKPVHVFNPYADKFVRKARVRLRDVQRNRDIYGGRVEANLDGFISWTNEPDRTTFRVCFEDDYEIVDLARDQLELIE